MLDVFASFFWLNKVFIRLDFPTFDRPENAISSSSDMGSCDRLATLSTKLTGSANRDLPVAFSSGVNRSQLFSILDSVFSHNQFLLDDGQDIGQGPVND